MPEWKTPFEKIEIGTGRKVKDGSELAIITIGHIGNLALKAAQELEKEGISVAVFDARFVKPLDASLFHTILSSFENILTVEDGSLMGGFGSAVLEFAADNGYYPKIKRLGIPDEVIEHGEQMELYRDCGYDVAGISKAVCEMLEVVKA